jgi:hypothetical protein
MNFLTRLFGSGSKPSDPAKTSQLASDNSQQPDQAAQSEAATRRELLRVSLVHTLRRHGIPSTWITADTLTATTRQRQSGIHWRLIIRHWDERLPLHQVAFQNSLISRVQMFDPLVENWLMGISWQFALPNESACPPMPHPGLWTSEQREDVPAPDRKRPPDSSAHVIEGPIHIRNEEDDPKADLAKLMALRDADFQANATDPGAGTGNEKTQPMYLATEPGKLNREA